jgi:hypothetical protein
VRRLHEEMPLPGKVERPQRVTRSRRIKAESNAAARVILSEAANEWSEAQGEVEGLSCAVLKLDTEGDGAARRAKFLELSACEERRQFFIWERG